MGGDRKRLCAGSRRCTVTVVHIVWGVGKGPTPTASFDAALAEAGVHNYNLSMVSSVIPGEAPISVVGTAPDLGQPGDQLTTVAGRATVESGPICAGLGWTRAEDDGPGVVYEATGTDRMAVENRIERGLAAARDLRDWEFTEDGARVVETTANGTPTTAVVLATFGRARPLADRAEQA